MRASTFLQVLKTEVARMQVLHPERLGELARAHALILHGQVLPSADDPQTGMVLSSDGEKHYTVNGACDCQAGQHGKPCKHLQSWRLYQYIERKVAAVEPKAAPAQALLSEAPASCNVSVTIGGHKVQVTLRDTDEHRMLARLQAVLAQYPVPQPSAQASPQGQGEGQGETPQCPAHGALKKSTKGKGWYCPHKLDEDTWCPSKGT